MASYTVGSRPIARGVRKINEQLVQDGRAFIITEEDEGSYSWEDIPYGSIKVDSKKGLMFVKIQGQSDWIPAPIVRDKAYDADGNLVDNSHNGYTVSIAKDAIVMREIYTITEINQSTKKFRYKNEYDQTFTGDISERGFHFEIHKGHYPPGRNMIEVIVDDCLYRSASSGGLIEQSEKKFILTEPPVVGMELTVKYIKLIRIGNPYPRLFLRRGGYDAILGIDSNGEPEDAEVGDMWLDFTGDIEKPDYYLGESLANRETIPWNRIRGYPATVDAAIACGLMTDVGKKVHDHDVNTLSGQLKLFTRVKETLVDRALWAKNAENAYKLDERDVGYSSGQIPYVGPNGKLPSSILPEVKMPDIPDPLDDASQIRYIDGWSVKRALDWIKDYLNNLKATQISTKWGINVEESLQYLLDHLGIQPGDLVMPDTSGLGVPRGVIVPYNGTTAPDGWAICDGTNGTPDLRDRFLVGGGWTYTFGEYKSAGLPNITGTFNPADFVDDRYPPECDGAFGYFKNGKSDAEDGGNNRGYAMTFDASKSNPIYGKSNTVMPHSWVCTFIMKL